MKTTERICTACGDTFTIPARSGRPHTLCPRCRETEVTGTVRVVWNAESGRVRLLTRRPGQKTKFNLTDLAPDEAVAIAAELMFKAAGVKAQPKPQLEPKRRKAT